MDISLLMKVIGAGFLLAFSCHLLSKAGRENEASLVSLIGIVLLLTFLITKLGELISVLRQIFGF